MFSKSKRINIVFTFILLFISGIPIWWNTTTTYRSSVDFSLVNEYFNQNATTDKVLWPLFKEFFNKVGKISHDIEVKSSTEYSLSFTLLNSDPIDIIPKWDFPYLSNKYIQPFIEQISDIANFTVQSKISHYATLLKSPLHEPKDNSYYIPSSFLSEYINPNEWQLDTPSTNQPTLNFIIYIPSKSQSPLYIRSDQDSNSFLIPQWGGIIIHNTNTNKIKQGEIVDLTNEIENQMITFKYQLKELLGIKSNHEQQKSLSSDIILSDQEIDFAIKRYTAENINVTLSTLFSLSKLIDSLPNMLVLDNIRDEVKVAIDALQQAHKCLQEKDYKGALKASKIALYSSESAFFDKNMLSQLYFPDEHKYAVYTPLFVPVCFPIIAGVFQEFSNYRKKKLKKQ
ncbi:hypothetical protein DICPUDRAFT_54711 [Dictyostelium purpureum]|uniref:GPI transamidase component PIG-S n=1 Tax=Dictyostelium purpureum TaxID=5786 RepID=F0ZIE2_DICPU|nr:uncharacterized protein DICPUDRAFT_54711 [Dictyostelium purpureum]EGC36310.1 hypothetical protein DICPUDRAFT_54711 [Dictyostelium purpureum]|eukprot:XP_003287188.1 hypothetical protein DICPUDRAFT_54711 [Dictyostelium purpureum]